MSLEKNQEYEITIEDIGNDGEGIGHIDGMAVFVKDTVPGDVARIKIIKDKKKYAYGRLVEIIAPSNDRVDPICPHARRCGGCSIMQVSYEKQLEWKQSKVANCLKRIGGLANVEGLMEPIVGMESYDGKREDENFPAIRYRNKAQFPVGKDKDGNIVIGFYAGRTHSIIDTDVCYLQHPINDEIIKRFRNFLEKYNVEPYNEEKHTGLVRHILTRVGERTGEIMVCVIINGDELVGNKVNVQKNGLGECEYDKSDGLSGQKLKDSEKVISGSLQDSVKTSSEKHYFNVEQELIECMKDIKGMTSIVINVNKEKTNRILGSECRTIWGSDTITDYIGNVKYQISALSFFQVNPKQTEKLYGKALEYAGLTGKETVWDLYCGIGTISLFIAQKAKKVMGVEIIPEAIGDAERNAKLNGINNAEFFVGKAEEVLPREYEKNGVYADVIVVDPPRKGCDIVALRTMLRMAPKRIVYVSCDPATLARDLKILTGAENGNNNIMYKVKKVCAFDQFGHSGHVEVVSLLQRMDSQVLKEYAEGGEEIIDQYILE